MFVWMSDLLLDTEVYTVENSTDDKIIHRKQIERISINH